MSDAYERDQQDNAYRFHSAVDDDQPEEEQQERLAAKRKLVLALTEYFTRSRAYRLAVEGLKCVK